ASVGAGGQAAGGHARGHTRRVREAQEVQAAGGHARGHTRRVREVQVVRRRVDTRVGTPPFMPEVRGGWCAYVLVRFLEVLPPMLSGGFFEPAAESEWE